MPAAAISNALQGMLERCFWATRLRRVAQKTLSPTSFSPKFASATRQSLFVVSHNHEARDKRQEDSMNFSDDTEVQHIGL